MNKGGEMQKQGEKISHWQIHNITVPKGHDDEFKASFPDVLFPPILFTGTTCNTATGRWYKGDHMRSTYIVSINKERNEIITTNTIYEMDPMTENMDSFGDLGNDVLSIFY